MEVLQIIQDAFGYLDDRALAYVADHLGLPLNKVRSVASFYPQFTLKPRGLHTCVICIGTACYVQGAVGLLGELGESLGIKVGGTTPDGQISVLKASCLGICNLAPAAVMDGEVGGPVAVPEVLSRLRQLGNVARD
jgi:bidirectional [NiFe] hydrogenase diaphorase subunit